MFLEQQVLAAVERQTDRFYGKYRGLVAVNEDPLSQGRIKALVPEILGVTPSTWALPVTPYAGSQSGLFTIPTTGSGVWIEFEAGEVSRPIWSGCWWGSAQVPLDEDGSPPTFMNKLLATDTGLLLAFNDTTQTITLKDSAGTNVLQMTMGTAQLTGKVTVTLDAPLIQHGQSASHPAVFGDQLLTYLTQIVTMFNVHMHPGELAIGVLPVTPMVPVPQLLPPTPELLSVKNILE
jgi:hypothetical protein